MAHTYRPRAMPRHYMEGAPAVVRAQVLDLIRIIPAAPLDFDVILRPGPNPAEVVGLDFDTHGARGCHFFLKPYEMRAYRARNRRKRIAWQDLPADTRAAIVAYLEE